MLRSSRLKEVERKHRDPAGATPIVSVQAIALRQAVLRASFAEIEPMGGVAAPVPFVLRAPRRPQARACGTVAACLGSHTVLCEAPTMQVSQPHVARGRHW
jgi:hypothetical protein